MPQPLVTNFDAISDDLIIETYDNLELHLRDSGEGHVVIKPKDLQALISAVALGNQMVGDMIVEHQGKKQVEISNMTGKGIVINPMDYDQFVNMLRLYFREIRGSF